MIDIVCIKTTAKSYSLHVTHRKIELNDYSVVESQLAKAELIKA